MTNLLVQRLQQHRRMASVIREQSPFLPAPVGQPAAGSTSPVALQRQPSASSGVTGGAAARPAAAPTPASPPTPVAPRSEQPSALLQRVWDGIRAPFRPNPPQPSPSNSSTQPAPASRIQRKVADAPRATAANVRQNRPKPSAQSIQRQYQVAPPTPQQQFAQPVVQRQPVQTQQASQFAQPVIQRQTSQSQPASQFVQPTTFNQPTQVQLTRQSGAVQSPSPSLGAPQQQFAQPTIQRQPAQIQQASQFAQPVIQRQPSQSPSASQFVQPTVPSQPAQVQLTRQSGAAQPQSPSFGVPQQQFVQPTIQRQPSQPQSPSQFV
ncbi:MAG: hypothetical protein ACPG8W_10915, partial [Candidatus Promineifilaceae bacterium]